MNFDEFWSDLIKNNQEKHGLVGVRKIKTANATDDKKRPIVCWIVKYDQTNSKHPLAMQKTWHLDKYHSHVYGEFGGLFLKNACVFGACVLGESEHGFGATDWYDW